MNVRSLQKKIVRKRSVVLKARQLTGRGMTKSDAVDIFEFSDYRKFLASAVDGRSKSTSGIKSKLAAASGVQPSYITKVLAGDAHLSLEQGERAGAFFGLDSAQNLHLVLLISMARAGTPSLRRTFEIQVENSQLNYLNSKKALFPPSPLSEADKGLFYSSWQYAALLHCLATPRLNTMAAAGSHLRIPKVRCKEIFSFLESRGLIRVANGKVVEVRGWDFNVENTALIVRDHANWRLMAIRAFENHPKNNLHFSAVVSLSEADFPRIKKMLLDTLGECRKIIQDSKEEKVASLLVDFFGV